MSACWVLGACKCSSKHVLLLLVCSCLGTASDLGIRVFNTICCKCLSDRPHVNVTLLQLLAAGSDLSIRVWSTQDWSLQAQLRGHSEVVHVLSGHPFDPRLVVSAGHDGRSVLWDAEAGVELRR